MAAILQTDIFKLIFLNENCCILIKKSKAPISQTFSKCIFMSEKFCISKKISQEFVPKGPIDNNSALVHIRAIQRQAINLNQY